jgi:FixJ family two-component response regulator
MRKTQAHKKPLVAVVDDDTSMRETTQDLLESAGMRAATFASAEAFLQSTGVEHVACLVTDIRMPGISGLELQERLATAGRPIPTVLMTAYPEESVRARALKSGVVGFLPKPFTAEELLACIGTALGRHRI